METVLQAKNMTKIYGMGSKQPFTALENIDLEIKTGEFIVVMGPSGSGKSTLVNNISTIDMPTKGNLYILNQEVKQMSENQLGDKHHRFCGYFITPFGKFGSSHEAARNNKLIDRKRVYKWCKNPNKIISKSSFSKNSYLNNTFDESIIGKTFGELGFNFEEITK